MFSCLDYCYCTILLSSKKKWEVNEFCIWEQIQPLHIKIFEFLLHFNPYFSGWFVVNGVRFFHYILFTDLHKTLSLFLLTIFTGTIVCAASLVVLTSYAMFFGQWLQRYLICRRIIIHLLIFSVFEFCRWSL